MRPDELDAAVSVWREANIARGAPHGLERTARIREKLSAPDAPPAQRTGVGLPLVLHVLEVARSLGRERVDVWTAEENRPARGLYERAGMTLTGRTAPLRSSSQLQYERGSL